MGTLYSVMLNVLYRVSTKPLDEIVLITLRIKFKIDLHLQWLNEVHFVNYPVIDVFFLFSSASQRPLYNRNKPSKRKYYGSYKHIVKKQFIAYFYKVNCIKIIENDLSWTREHVYHYDNEKLSIYAITISEKILRAITNYWEKTRPINMPSWLRLV